MENEEFRNSQEPPREATIIALGVALDVIKSLDRELSVKISAGIKQLGTRETDNLLIKPLKRKLMELSIKQYRIIFFRAGGTIYVVDVFKKQSRKTPWRIIRRAEKIYKKFE